MRRRNGPVFTALASGRRDLNPESDLRAFSAGDFYRANCSEQAPKRFTGLK